MGTHIDEVEFTIFDTETTGLSPLEGDRIVEIAGIRVRGPDKIASFQSLVNTTRNISEAAFKVNNITAEMLKGASCIEKVLPDFLDFTKGSSLCSYNAGFDLEFLNNELNLIGRQPLNQTIVFDILKMARKLLPHQERYALRFVAQSLGLNSKQAHRAFSDVELALDVFYKLKEILQLKGVTDFMQICGLFAINTHFLENINAKKLAQIQEAINLGARVQIKYLSASGLEVTQREVIPKQIKQDRGRSYLVGYCSLKKDERTFSIDGILHLEIL